MEGDALLTTLRRWFEIIEGQKIDPESFAGYEVWMHAQVVIELADKQQDLPPAAINVLSEIVERLGLTVGAPPAAIGSALEQNFGGCPYGDEALTKITHYLRSQLNAFEQTQPKKNGPSLTGEEKPGTTPHRFPTNNLWGD